MHDAKRTISALLVAVADALNSMDDHEFKLLIRGEGKLHFVPSSRNGKKPIVDPRLEEDVNEIAEKLNAADSRETAEGVIASIDRPRRKEFLVRLAQVSGVRVESRDSIAKIEHKLIETVVGSKLRSKAFREVAF